MKLLTVISAVIVLSVAQFRRQLDPHNNTLACACISRDVVNTAEPSTTTETTSTTSTTTIATLASSTSIPEESIKRFIPYRYWQLYKKNIQSIKVNSTPPQESYMDRLLSFFRQEPTTTTLSATQSTTQSTPTTPTTHSFLVQEDSPITNLGKQLFYRYFDRIKAQFDFLDRFICSCEGDLAAMLNSKTFISMSVIHD